MTPTVTLTGKLQTIAGGNDAGSVVITLINYGSNQPKVSGTSILSEITQTVQAASDGTWSATLWGNDQITPGNTLYEIAVYPSSGADTATEASVAKYKLDTPGTFDLVDLVPAMMVLPRAYYTPMLSVNGKSGYVMLSAGDLNAMPANAVAGAGQTLQLLTPAISPLGESSVLLTWANPFPNDAYTVMCSVQDPTGSLQVNSWAYVTGGLGITVAVSNSDRDHTRVGTIHAVAYPA